MKNVTNLMMLGTILLVSASRGDEWSWKRIAWEGVAVVSVVALPDSPHVVYAVINWGVPSEHYGVYKSADGGVTWRFLDQSGNAAFLGHVTVDPKNSAAVYCGTSTQVGNPYGWPWRSLDAGETWQRTSDPMTRYIVSPWEEGVILGVISHSLLYGLFMSTDDGQTWRVISSGGEIAFGSEWARFHGSDPGTIVAPYIGPETETYGLGVSRDGGATWELAVPGWVIVGLDQDTSDHSHWVVSGVSVPFTRERLSIIAESFDDWRTWETWPASAAGGQILFDPATPSTMYMHGRYWDHDRVTRSDDGGHTWEPMGDGLALGWATVELAHAYGHPGELLAARTDGLWLWTNRVVAEEAPLAKAGRVRIEAVSPCPFRDRVTAYLSCEVPGVVHVAVYSLEGRLVRTLMEDRTVAGSHLLTWDGLTSSGLPAGPGAYVVRVASSGNAAEALVIRVP